MNIGKNALPAATVSMPRSRISFTRRSCSVPFARSTRPLACEEFGTDDVDVERMQSAPKLRHSIAARRVFLVHPKHSMLVGVERDRLAVPLQIGPRRFEIIERRLRLHKLQMHQPARRIVDVNE